jgi:hypothetical protein
LANEWKINHLFIKLSTIVIAQKEELQKKVFGFLQIVSFFLRAFLMYKLITKKELKNPSKLVQIID